MKFRFVFGFILLILALIGLIVGLPYLLKIIKSNQFLKLSFPKYVSTSTPGYYYNNKSLNYSPNYSQPSPSAPGVSMGVYRYGKGQISLKASSGGGLVDITGWKIRSLQKGETVIGKGYALPQVDAALSDVLLGSGESANIIAGLSPLAGNFRINNCFGWLGNIYSIDYSINYCPRIELKDLSGLDSVCQDLILRASSCHAPSDDTLNWQSSQCRLWVEKNMNYNSCVLKHKGESDFYKGWQIYTGNNNLFFDQLHDRIELRDQAGLLVDSYEY